MRATVTTRRGGYSDPQGVALTHPHVCLTSKHVGSCRLAYFVGVSVAPSILGGLCAWGKGPTGAPFLLPKGCALAGNRDVPATRVYLRCRAMRLSRLSRMPHFFCHRQEQHEPPFPCMHHAPISGECEIDCPGGLFCCPAVLVLI